MGINARASLDPRWIGHSRATVDGYKTATVRIMRRNQTASVTYDPATKTYSNPNTVIYDNLAARIQPYGINLDINIANDPTSRRLVLVQLSQPGLLINNDDVLEVISSVNADLDNYRYDIRGSIASDMEWGTNLVCEVNLKMNL